MAFPPDGTPAMPSQDPRHAKDNLENDDDDDDSVCDLGFARLDLRGVNFDNVNVDAPNTTIGTTAEDVTTVAAVLNLERRILVQESLNDKTPEQDEQERPQLQGLFQLADLITNGRYVDALKSSSANWLLDHNVDAENHKMDDHQSTTTAWTTIQSKLSKHVQSFPQAVEAELVAVAALNLFLQLNYTGPVMEDAVQVLRGVNPHSSLSKQLKVSNEDVETQNRTLTARRSTKYHNAVLSELAVDGQWPCQVAEVPYLLLLARCILSTLSSSSSLSESSESSLHNATRSLSAVHLWHARAVVAHERLLMAHEPSLSLRKEAEAAFEQSLLAVSQQKEITMDGTNTDNRRRLFLAAVYLEYGLACYHFDDAKKGKQLFGKAMEASGLSVEVTGSEGKRTKYQQHATAQMIVRATSTPTTTTTTTAVVVGADSNTNDEHEVNDEDDDPATNDPALQVKSQMIEHTEDSILYERIQYEDAKDNEVSNLTVLDQSILLALCLDVKNTNPADGLTGEEMSAYLARVLQHHDDWMVYSTALLERAWLEFEGNHTKERAILQMQALADQHTNRLTLTQSTRQSVEESSPVQDRMRHVHGIVYPPRWHMLRDMADRYASLGIVTSAAEIFAEIESWDEVVECYRRAGKEKRAEEIVRERLKLHETPRMWMALGDLTEDPSHYEKAVELSNGRFSQAYVCLGKHYFDKGELTAAKDAYKKALALRPLISSVWFRVGTISMQLGDWDSALQAFSEVVQQQPEEAEAWANVAAVHMHNKNPAKAYPALVESLKYGRNNWRVWVSKLYTSLDLEKYDEAIQACNMLLDLKVTHSASGVPDMEEKCIRAIVSGTLAKYQKAQEDEDAGALDVQRRSLSRVHSLLERLSATTNEPWVFETTAYFHESVGQDQHVFDNLMKEYRALSSVRNWEKDDAQVRKVCQVVSQIVHYQRGTKEELIKSKFLLTSAVKKVKQARVDAEKLPNELTELEKLLDKVTEDVKASS